MKSFSITTLGCKVNQYESASFHGRFEELGLIAAAGDNADIVVINTCAVTGSAGAQSRRAVFKALRRHPRAKIVVCGCYAELDGRKLACDQRLAGREILVVGNGEKDQLVALSLAESDSSSIHLGDIRAERDICRLPVNHFPERARAYLRIQDGCQSYCSYCIVPFTRGPSRSLPPEEVIAQAKILADGGHREIVLTGIHIGNYGKDLAPRHNFATLLDSLSLATPEVGYRLSSLEPTEIDDCLLSLMRERANIRPHLHIPLQSGCDRVLQRMNRHYSTAEFAETVASCRTFLPDAAIGIDILVGFPGEDEGEFEESKQFLKTLPCSYLHVFPYSLRPGTKAAEFPNQVGEAVKKARVASLLTLGEEKRQAFQARFVGTTRMVLVEGHHDRQGMARGFTDNYISVRFPADSTTCGRELPVRLLTVRNDHVLGEMVQP